MPSEKLFDLAVKVGEYFLPNGEKKNRYKTIGAFFKKDGECFGTLDKTFNPAGVESEPGRGSIFFSCFTPKTKDGQQQSQQPSQPSQNQRVADNRNGSSWDDSFGSFGGSEDANIPF